MIDWKLLDNIVAALGLMTNIVVGFYCVFGMSLNFGKLVANGRDQWEKNGKKNVIMLIFFNKLKWNILKHQTSILLGARCVKNKLQSSLQNNHKGKTKLTNAETNKRALPPAMIAYKQICNFFFNHKKEISLTLSRS